MGETSAQEFHAARPGSGVAGAELRVIEIGGRSFPTQQRVARTLAAMPGMVADRRPILVSKDGHDGAIEVENQPGAESGLMKEMIEQAVVDAMPVLPEEGRCLEQEATQGFRVGERGGKPIR